MEDVEVGVVGALVDVSRWWEDRVCTFAFEVDAGLVFGSFDALGRGEVCVGHEGVSPCGRYGLEVWDAVSRTA